MTAIVGHIESFQVVVEDWEQCIERLEQFFITNGITKTIRSGCISNGDRYTDYALLGNLLAPAKPATKRYAELVAVLVT